MSLLVNRFTIVNACKKSKRWERNEDTQDICHIVYVDLYQIMKKNNNNYWMLRRTQEKKSLRTQTIYNRWLFKRLKKIEKFQEQTHKKQPSQEEKIKLEVKERKIRKHFSIASIRLILEMYNCNIMHYDKIVCYLYLLKS